MHSSIAYFNNSRTSRYTTAQASIAPRLQMRGNFREKIYCGEGTEEILFLTEGFKVCGRPYPGLCWLQLEEDDVTKVVWSLKQMSLTPLSEQASPSTQLLRTDSPAMRDPGPGPREAPVSTAPPAAPSIMQQSAVQVFSISASDKAATFWLWALSPGRAAAQKLAVTPGLQLKWTLWFPGAPSVCCVPQVWPQREGIKEATITATKKYKLRHAEQAQAPGLLQCKKQTKNNAAAEKAFPDLERDHRLCTHYVAFRYRVQSSATNRQPQGAQKFGHPEHLAPARAKSAFTSSSRAENVHRNEKMSPDSTLFHSTGSTILLHDRSRGFTSKT
ncbi:hypothetical protein Anapl_07162 [Anas platyrhynchos]|uniref:Uncharacterized protein n=1 Tax=Anas platyrhynchos TaxID=8839 RepID=R0JQ20_ANAPL|nr:hypothetical protein Anapl_07162 [Anas platyrhynchos]